MKTQLKLLAFAMAFMSMLFQTSKISAQYCGSYGVPGRFEIQTTALNPYLTFTVGTGACGGPGTATLSGIGINFAVPNTPRYMLDILSNLYISDGINLSAPGTPGFFPNAVAYSIGGGINPNTGAFVPLPFAWHSGDSTSCYFAIHSGFSTPAASTAYHYNTVVGNKALMAFNGNPLGCNRNTAIGYATLTSNANSYFNTGVGANALGRLNSPICFYNTAVGDSALYHFNPPLPIQANNSAFGSLALNHDSIGTDNVAAGYKALYHNVAGNQNTAFGNFALANDSSNYNTACGYVALSGNTSGQYNTATGWFAMSSSKVTGTTNTANGTQALELVTSGSGNTSTGSISLRYDSSGSDNTADGLQALRNNIKGNFNSAVGVNSLVDDTVNYNSAVGAFSGANISGGDSNSSAGAYSLNNVTLGSGNSALGFNAGYSQLNPLGKDNSFLGSMSDAKAGSQPINGATAIGTKAVVGGIKPNGILGNNNNNTVTAGRSGLQPTGYPTMVTRLETDVDHGISPFNVASGTNPPAYVNPGNGGTGWSGLRFDDLNATDKPGKNPGAGVLALDSMGNVCYVIDTLNNGGIGYCAGSGLAPLTGDGGYNMNNHNFYFEGNYNGKTVNNVLIGYPCDTVPYAKLEVLQYSNTTATRVPGTIGISVVNNDIGNCTTYPELVIGLKSLVPKTLLVGQSTHIAGWFEAPIDPTVTHCCSVTNSAQAAIYVPSSGGGAYFGYPTVCTAMGYNATVNINGSLCLNGVYHTSDSTLKTDVAPINNALKSILRLQGVSYKYIPGLVNDSVCAGTQYGFISQQVERVIPNLVYTQPSGIKTLAYTNVIPWLVEGIKEQQLTIDSLRTNVANLKVSHDSLLNAFKSYTHCLDSLCGSSHHAPIRGNGNGGGGIGNSTGTSNPGNTQDIALSSSAMPILYQNNPNPFEQGTTINYFLPEGTMGAKILFFDSYGSQLKSVDLTQTGNGTLNVSADNLSAGIYTYSLVVDNKVIDTKRMILQK